MNKLVFIVLIVLLLASGCSTPEPINTTPQPSVMFVVSDQDQEHIVLESDHSQLVYEVEMEKSSRSWLFESAEARHQLNDFYYQQWSEDQAQLQAEKQKTKNWYMSVDGVKREGHDVLKDMRGEFDDYDDTPVPERLRFEVIHFELD